MTSMLKCKTCGDIYCKTCDKDMLVPCKSCAELVCKNCIEDDYCADCEQPSEEELDHVNCADCDGEIWNGEEHHCDRCGDHICSDCVLQLPEDEDHYYCSHCFEILNVLSRIASPTEHSEGCTAEINGVPIPVSDVEMHEVINEPIVERANGTITMASIPRVENILMETLAQLEDTRLPRRRGWEVKLD